MLKAFKEHIDMRFPFLGNSRLLLACSGGVDSTILADLLNASKIKFDLAHCNFGLRSGESDEDQKFVEELAKKYNSDFFCKKFELKKESGSIQLMARNHRYDWFLELLDEHGYDHVLTAHHADDKLETFLINLARGTGIEGLTGIPEQNGKVLRPLLPFTRNEILAYAKKKALQWREDKSNTETKYIRNKIRHEIVPELKMLHPTFPDNFQKTQDHLQQMHSWIESQVAFIKQKLFIKKHNLFKIRIENLIYLTPIEMSLYLLFKTYGFTNSKNLMKLLDAESGKQLQSKTHRLVKNREHLLLTKLEVDETAVYHIDAHESKIENPVVIRMQQVKTLGDGSKSSIYVDNETLNYPLMIRKWENGDYFYPFGMKGKKKVAKFLKDEKVDIIAKERQWLLCSEDKIVWVIGRRADDRFKVTDNTTHIVKFTWLE